MKQKYIIIGGIVILALGVWFAFFRSTASPATTTLPAVTDAKSPFGSFSNDFIVRGGANATASLDQATLPETASTGSGNTLSLVSGNEQGPTPVSGAIGIIHGKDEYVRYVEKGSGHIFEKNIATGAVQRLTSTTIPKITEALWLPDASGAYLRYQKDGGSIATFYAALGTATTTATSTPREVQGLFLPADVTAVASDGKSAFFITAAEGASGFLSLADGTKSKAIWSSPLAEWNAAWPNAKTIALQTKAAASAPGFLYFLDPKTGSATLKLGGLDALSALVSPDASKILYSSADENGSASLQVFSLRTGDVAVLPFFSFAEKCAWSADSVTIYCGAPGISTQGGTYPDDWYMGKVSFDDQLVRFDTKTNAGEVFRKEASTPALDATNLFLSPRGDTLFFTDKQTSMLWMLPLGTTTPAAPTQSAPF